MNGLTLLEPISYREPKILILEGTLAQSAGSS